MENLTHSLNLHVLLALARVILLLKSPLGCHCTSLVTGSPNPPSLPLALSPCYSLDNFPPACLSDLFQKLFRQDLLVASLFRNFLLAERIMRSYNCTPVSSPRLPPTYMHAMW